MRKSTRQEIEGMVDKKLYSHWQGEQNRYNALEGAIEKITEDLERLYGHLGIELKWNRPKEGYYSLIKKEKK